MCLIDIVSFLYSSSSSDNRFDIPVHLVILLLILNIRYSLFAVVNHSGSLHNGHYTCYIRPQQDQVVLLYDLL